MNWFKRLVLNFAHWLGLHHEGHLKVVRVIPPAFSSPSVVVCVHCTYCKRDIIKEKYHG